MEVGQNLRILITGGTGVLGRAVVPQLKAQDLTVRVMSRHAAPSQPWPEVEWVQSDLATGAQLDVALADVDVVIHAASRPFTNGHAVDVLGTERLIQETRAAGVQHLIYPSIVGIDRIPFAYYQQKLAAEERIELGAVPWSILRATQFHSLIDRTLRIAAWSPILLLPTDLKFQPVDPVEVATRLAQCVASGPQGRLPELAGPEVLPLGDLAQIWLDVRKLRRWVVRLPLPGRVAASFRRGDNTSLRAERGKVTWKQWLGRHWLPHSRLLDSP